MQAHSSPSSAIVTSGKSLDSLTHLLENLLADKRKLFLLCDENSYFNCLPLLHNIHPLYKTIPVIRIRGGEKRKTLQTCEFICNELLMHRADKRSVLINLGGGIMTDIGGFTSGIFKRGIDCIHVPTTLLAMTDAALGGKTAVNISGYKNQAGSFVQPILIFNYLPFLKTLPARHLHNGLAEMLKHGLIAHTDYFKELVRSENFISQPLVEFSIHIKQNITTSDPYENKGRKLLNFGHTIGHAVESYFQSDGKDLLHGEAVAIGILCESFISSRQEGLPDAELNIIRSSINKYYNLSPFKFSANDIMDYMLADKKNTNGIINFSLLKNIGNGVYDRTVDNTLIENSIQWYLNN